MMLLGLYGLAFVALATGTGAIYMALREPFPLRWLYWHSFVRKPIAWSLLVGASAWVAHATIQTGTFPWSTLPPLVLIALGLVPCHRQPSPGRRPADTPGR